MKINKHYKLEKVVSKDDLRPVIKKIFIDDEYAVATDGKIMAIVPIEADEKDKTGVMMDAEVLKALRDFVHQDIDEIEMIIDDEKVTLPNGISMPLQLGQTTIDKTFPDYQSLIPKGDPKITIALDVKLLAKLALAFGCKSLILGYYSDKKAVKITPFSITSKEIGLIMPLPNDKIENSDK